MLSVIKVKCHPEGCSTASCCSDAASCQLAHGLYHLRWPA